MKLEGKVALVTGGTSGIGGASARLFAEEGAAVIAVARNEKRGKEFESACREKGLNVSFLPCDVTDREQITGAHKKIHKEFGYVDILMNSAGILRTGGLKEITDEDWDAVYQANLKSVLYICQEFIDELIDRKGVILNNASINGLQRYIKGAKSYMYATSKAALIQFTQYLAKGIRQAISHDYEEDGMDLSGGEAQKAAIARAIYKAAPVVILDEPTAALDPYAEKEIHERFFDNLANETMLSISHRLSSCRLCDRIIVLHGGRLVQQGSHRELLRETDGKYARLWEMQAQYYC